MKKSLWLLPLAAMFGCSDYADEWEDSYGVAQTKSESSSSEKMCDEGVVMSVVKSVCSTNFICKNNTWVSQELVCDNVRQKEVCEEGYTTSVDEGDCTTEFHCVNNVLVAMNKSCNTKTHEESSSSVAKSSSSKEKSSSSVAKSSSSVTKSSSSTAKSSSSKEKPSSSVAKSSSSVAKSSSSTAKSSSSKEKSSSSVAESSSSVQQSSSSSKKVSTGAFPTWFGADGNERVDTRLDAGAGTSGYWFSYDDDGDGGDSKLVWGGEMGNETSPYSLENIVIACNGVCGTAELRKGILTYNPFMGIGFYVAGDDPVALEPAAADASAWGGVCITYKSSIRPSLEMGLGDFDAVTGYANPSIQLDAATNEAAVKRIAWADFKQPAWYKGTTKIDGPTAAKQLVSIKFKMQGLPGSYDFNVCAIGPYDGDCPSSCD